MSIPLSGISTAVKGGKAVLVMLESLAGSGHKIFRVRYKPVANTPGMETKLEMVDFDPYVQQNVLYREVKKMKTLVAYANKKR